jgi:methyl-accepting chemotaxis protein
MAIEQDSDDRSARLAFMQVNDETRGIVRDFWKFVEPALPALLEGFYQHVTAIPHLAKLVGNDIPRLKKAQGTHWQRLFSGRFDDAYFTGVRQIGLVHYKIGLEPRWYIGGYNYVLSGLADLAARTYRWSPSKRQATIRAVNCAVLLDMDVAISVYQDATNNERAQRGERVDSLIGGFVREVSGPLNALASSSAELNATATSMAGTAEETTRQATGVAAASEQASSNMQTVAAATEQLAASVGEIGRQVAQSAEIATQAVREAQATTTAMRGLADMAQSVDTVVKIINEIAGQTNLLALNATIEAARAGDAGKGFAVVASEVKALANRTAKATEEIGQQIGAIQSATGASVARIEAIGATITEMNQIAATIAAAVEEQGAATQEIARNVQEAATGTGQVSANIGGVSQAASETGVAAAQVQAASGDVARQGQTLKQEVDRFIQAVRAA